MKQIVLWVAITLCFTTSALPKQPLIPTDLLLSDNLDYEIINATADFVFDHEDYGDKKFGTLLLTYGSTLWNWAHKAIKLTWIEGKKRKRYGFLRKLNDSTKNEIVEVVAHGHCDWKIYDKPYFGGKSLKIKPGQAKYPKSNPLSAEIFEC